MANKKEEPIVNNETGSLKVKEKQEVKQMDNETTGNVTKVKAKMTKEPVDLSVITKVDMSKAGAGEQPIVTTTNNVIQEITEEEQVQEISEKVVEAIEVSEKYGIDLPEGITKLVDFMSDTGGDINDYVKINRDYSDMDNQTLLHEYYKQTKPHLNEEEISFLMEDQFSYEEDVDDDKEIKRKKLALKEQVANAKQHLDGLKSKYYKDIKSGSKLTNEQKEAINFYNEQQEIAKQGKSITNDFVNKTNRFFGDQFKGFEYNVGDKKFRYNVQDVDKVKNIQINIDNFIGKFLDENGKMSKESEYHKSLYTAMNADAIANHFYEQGKADAIKDSVTSAKNIDMTPRQELNEPFKGGTKVRVIGDDSPAFKFKIKNKN